MMGCKTYSQYVFQHADPESKGYNSEKLDALQEHLEKSGASSMLILAEGEVIFEWGNTNKKHVIHSIRKSMLNSLVGIAVAQGKIDTSMTIRELGIDDIEPVLSEDEKDARIADMLKSRSGVYHHAAGVSEGMLQGMPERGSYHPGEHYYYNNWDFNTLGAILEQETGRSIYDLFYEQIARPLGMHDYNGKYIAIDVEAEDVELPETDGFYQYEPSKSKYPAYHFRMSARDLAIYGQLYMNNGKWEGEQLIPRSWIDASTQAYSVYSDEYGLAYGMLWNVVLPDEGTQRNSFFHTGAGIHMLGIYPDLNLVFVHRVDTENNYSYKSSDLIKMLDLLFDSRIN
jgi:CubicO group peptidase (beta-lactamase class C family)